MVFVNTSISLRMLTFISCGTLTLKYILHHQSRKGHLHCHVSM